MTHTAAQIVPPGRDAWLRAGMTATSRPLRSLLVEDSRFDRSLVRYSAERAGVAIDFVDAATLAEAREHLAAEDFELIILDQRLPDGEGLDLPRRLAGARNAGVPIIMLSGIDADDLPTASVRAGCVGFIAKDDLSPERLAKAIRQAVARHTVGATETPSETGTESAELRMMLSALSDASRVARMKPLASRLMAVVSDLRIAATDADAAMALDEISELCLLLWLDLDAVDCDRGTNPRSAGRRQAMRTG